MTLTRRILSSICLSFAVLTSCRSTEKSGYELLKTADHYADLYNWRAASPIYKRAEALLRRNGDQRNGMYAHVGVLRLASSAPFTERSQELADLLRTNPLFLRDKKLRLFALTVKGDLDGEMDQTAARQDWIEVKDLATELGNTKWTYRAEGQLGFADYYDGDLASCQRRVTSALIAATKANDVGGEIFFLSTLAHGYEMQHLLLPLAIDYANKAIALTRAHPDAGSPTIANAALVRALAGTGHVFQAHQLVQRLLSSPNLDYADRDNYLSSAGEVALAEKNYQGAIRNFESAATIARAYGDFREAADLQSRVSELYLQIGNVSKAEELTRSAIRTLQASRASPLLPAKFDSLAQVLIAQKKYADARAVYEKAETLQDSLVGKADTLIVKTALITGAGQLYAHHFAVLADHFNDIDAAYNVVEDGRGRAIVDLLLSHRSSSPQALETERIISSLRLQLAGARSSGEMDRLRQAIFLAEQSRAVNPDLTILATRQFRPIPAQAIQESLGPSEMLLEYVLSEPNSYVLCFTQDTRRIIKLAGRRTVEKMVADYRDAVRRRVNPIRQAHDLYTTLLNPVPGIDAAAHWLIIPDGALNLLPFDALADGHEKYVVESHVVSYAPSASTLYLMRSKELVLRRGNALLAVGGIPYGQSGIKRKLIERGYTPDGNLENLPNSEREATVAATAIKNSENEELTGTAATETNLKRALTQQFGYVHLAVHAFSSDNPDRAALVVLSDPSADEDGFLEASEILQMRLSAKLVVLSGCETNVGPIEGEEGISALSTAFLLAGVRTVVSTLWPIEDEPSLILMEAFYKHLGAGDSVANSMAEAKRDVLSNFGRYTLPIDWAGFVVEGSEPKETVRAAPARTLAMK